tara:strand:- start:600 stop:1412 length:813 start_codon:yes stop_codon:yes gene_type:complete
VVKGFVGRTRGRRGRSHFRVEYGNRAYEYFKNELRENAMGYVNKKIRDAAQETVTLERRRIRHLLRQEGVRSKDREWGARPQANSRRVYMLLQRAIKYQVTGSINTGDIKVHFNADKISTRGTDNRRKLVRNLSGLYESGTGPYNTGFKGKTPIKGTPNLDSFSTMYMYMSMTMRHILAHGLATSIQSARGRGIDLSPLEGEVVGVRSRIRGGGKQMRFGIQEYSNRFYENRKGKAKSELAIGESTKFMMGERQTARKGWVPHLKRKPGY